MSRLGMDAYTLHLLGMAVEASLGHRVEVGRGPDEWWVESGGTGECIFAPTLADALAALLLDLGVEVPERPSEKSLARLEVFELPGMVLHEALPVLCDLYASDRLAVLALLEDGS